MEIKVWNNFSKRKNSTKQPTGGTTKVVYLKEDTSIEHPSFILNEGLANYTYVQAFGHFYFVEDVVNISKNQCEIRCVQDVLATYKGSIQSSSQFVERSTTAFNTKIADPLVTIINEETVLNTITETPIFDTTGLYLVSVLNDVGSGAGFTTYYIMTISNVIALATYCNRNLADTSSITEVTEWLQATFLKTADAIIECKWLPLSASVLQGLGGLSSEYVKIGKDTITSVSGLRLLYPVVTSTLYSVSLGSYFEDFRKASPYSKLMVYIPFYGIHQLNPLDISGDHFRIRFDIDITTGDTTAYIQDGALTISTINYSIATNCPVGKVGNEAGSVITSTLGTIGGIATAVASSGAGVVASGIGAASSAVNAVSAASSISPSVKGSQQGRSMMEHGRNVIVILAYNHTTDPDNLTPIVGRPLMLYRSLAGLSGYVKCDDASVDINGRSADRDEINAFLNSGIYIE